MTDNVTDPAHLWAKVKTKDVLCIKSVIIEF